MGALGITIGGTPFDHLIYHFVLTYSNWECGRICFSESFESLSEGLQQALWKLGGVPVCHQTDNLSAAVNKPANPEVFTPRYQSLLSHYKLTGCKIQPRHPNENGDVEQRHHRFKRALDQALMLRGSRDFATRKEYKAFLERLFYQLNANRQSRFKEELALCGLCQTSAYLLAQDSAFPWGQAARFGYEDNVYSVHSRLINGESDGSNLCFLVISSGIERFDVS